MSGFTADALETLDYDFTGFPSNTGGSCKGKGIVPEPTQAHLEAYATGIKTLFSIGKTEAEEGDVSAVAEKIDRELSSAEKAAEFLKLTAELCQQSPTAEELEELPPRIRNAFMKWVQKELADPKV